MSKLGGWLAALALAVGLTGPLAADEAIKPVAMLPAADGRLVCPIGLVLRGPETGSAAFQDGSILAWNEQGRVFYQQSIDATAFNRMTGVNRLSAGQSVLVSQRITFRVSDQPVRLAYVMNMLLANGAAQRQVHWFALRAEAQPLPAVEPGRPRFEVRPFPDEPEGLRFPRSGRLMYAFQVWLQETGGVPVTITSIEWQARDANGQVLGQSRLPATTTGGGKLICGPDSNLAIACQRLLLAPGQTATELALVATGKLDNGESVTAMYRAPLREAAAKESQTQVRLPLRGAWHVAASPGQGANFGRTQRSWTFDLLDRAGKPFKGEGLRPAEHYAFGREVIAPADGVVSAVIADGQDPTQALPGGWFPPSPENYVLVDHGRGERSYLGGLSKVGLMAVVGMRVKTGDLLGRVGCNGPYGRPALTYRLLHGAEAVPELMAIPPRFFAYKVLVNGKWAPASGWPEDDEQVNAD